MIRTKEEFKEAVRSRGKARLMRRNRARRTVLYGALPLCCIMIVIAVASPGGWLDMPSWIGATDENGEVSSAAVSPLDPDASIDFDANGGTVQVDRVVSVEIRRKNAPAVYCVYLDHGTVNQLIAALESLIALPPVESKEGEELDLGCLSGDPEENRITDYLIEVGDAEGNRQVYRLNNTGFWKASPSSEATPKVIPSLADLQELQQLLHRDLEKQ